MRNQCTKVTKTAKKKFEQSIIENVQRDPKGFWGYIRDKTNSKTMVADLKDMNGNLVNEDTGKAELLNSFFASVLSMNHLGSYHYLISDIMESL